MTQLTPQSKLPFKPLGNQILLAPLTMPEKVGSIFLPEKVRHPVNQGRIVDYGDNVTSNAFEVGHIVVFPLYSDSTIEMDRISYMVVDQSAILLSDFGHFSNIAKQEDAMIEDQFNQARM